MRAISRLNSVYWLAPVQHDIKYWKWHPGVVLRIRGCLRRSLASVYYSSAPPLSVNGTKKHSWFAYFSVITHILEENLHWLSKVKPHFYLAATALIITIRQHGTTNDLHPNSIHNERSIHLLLVWLLEGWFKYKGQEITQRPTRKTINNLTAILLRWPSDPMSALDFFIDFNPWLLCH